MTSNRVALAVFYGSGGALLLLVAAWPVWAAVDRPTTAALGVLATAVSAVLGRARRLPVLPERLLVLGGTVIVALSVRAVGGGPASTAVAVFAGWVVVYAALFLPPVRAVLHAAAALAASGAALASVGPVASALLQTVLLATTAASTGAVVAALTRRAREAATTDALTGLLNEAGLTQVATRDLAGVDEGSPGALLLLDLDRFGELNQALGREGGDDLLRQVAHAYRRATGRHGHVARLGGDDFALWLPRLPQPLRGCSVAELTDRLADAVAAHDTGPFEVAGVRVDVDVTVGVVLAPVHGTDLGTLMQRADTALHAARRADRPALTWEPAMDERTADGVQLHAQLRTAVAEGQLRLHYQPLVEAHSRRVRGVEALVRWQHPTRGLLPPGAFLPEAERTSVIVALTDWVLGEALDQAAAWWRSGRPLRVSVNLSARLVAHDGLVGQVLTHLRRSGVPADLLVLEVTESAVTTQPRRAAAALAELRALGVRIALDDFGTGYTSLAMLQDLPLDELKVDRRFVAGALRGGGDEAIVRAVLELAHHLDLEVVGEGVEDEATRRLLTELGYDLLQGYHFSRPVPADEVAALDFAPAPAAHAPAAPEVEVVRARSAERHALAAGTGDPVLQELTAVAARATGTPVAMVTLVGHEDQHVPAAVGVGPHRLPREQGVCHHAVGGDVVEVPDVSVDARFRDLGYVVGGDPVRFYAGAPVTDAAGRVLGTVCVLDRRPRTLTSSQRDVLRGLARAAGARLTSLADATADATAGTPG
ncbi:EAL domain-containing protein [Paenibacillus sp. TRM 82003]|uniref:EAL domain-containing protein n=1 Tax=Kineococcus sp. TRM81007 TaxID=2925831 RepID=UPI001F5A758E|nr:EAL domain-containing protein [Kineococcus sp. TRM81007]MCI2240511.1 EAL domain-containing protein [Kineococcus sp. TRM81007]MCI3925244.1 EAL domain-containing protein [Paenibacillus sp. TRM 82003]